MTATDFEYLQYCIPSPEIDSSAITIFMVRAFYVPQYRLLLV